jgi:hypothetical protein
VTTDTAPAPPDSLLAKLRADPTRAPEHLALAAAERHGPAAAKWVAEEGRREPAKLAKKVKRIHARYARFGGAATGVGGWMTVLPDLAAVGWIQSRMVFFLAAAHGYDPNDPMRPAELLVLWELYDDPVQARGALDGAGRSVASAAVDKAVSRDEEQALLSRLARAAAARGGRHMAGRMIPGAAILFNAIGNERGTRELADRAIRFYGGT